MRKRFWVCAWFGARTQRQPEYFDNILYILISSEYLQRLYNLCTTYYKNVNTCKVHIALDKNKFTRSFYEIKITCMCDVAIASISMNANARSSADMDAVIPLILSAHIYGCEILSVSQLYLKFGHDCR